LELANFKFVVISDECFEKYVYIKASVNITIINSLGDVRRFDPLNSDLNPIRHLLALLGAHHNLHVSRIRVNSKYHDLYTSVHYQLLGICTILTL